MGWAELRALLRSCDRCIGHTIQGAQRSTESIRLQEESYPSTRPVSIAAPLEYLHGSVSGIGKSNMDRWLEKLAFFLDVVEHLQSTTAQPIDVVAQDSAFDPVDKRTLRMLDLWVVEVPHAERLVAKDAMSFCPSYIWEFDLLARTQPS